MKEKNLAILWEKALGFLYTDKFVESLINFLYKRGVKSILDCSCGVGFPAIQLKKAGFDIECTDGSIDMIHQFRLNIDSEHLDIPNQLLSWYNLNKLGKKFDAVLCRGDSFIYIDSWEDKKKLDTNNFFVHARSALREMYNIINSNGILYIDITNKNEYNGDSVLDKNIRQKMIGNRDKISVQTTHDWDKRVRVAHIERLEGGMIFEHDFYSFLLKHDELQSMLLETGFKRVQEIVLDGEDNYNIFIAEK